MAAKLRLKCPHCSEAFNTEPTVTHCPECKQPISYSNTSCIYIYRQGSFYGVAGKLGIYLNGEPYGHIGNAELLCIPLPYGTYNIHSAIGIARKCRDMEVTLTPENPIAYAKVYIKPGFLTNQFVVEPVDPKLLEF